MKSAGAHCGRGFPGRWGGGEKYLVFGLPKVAADVAPPFSRLLKKGVAAASRRQSGLRALRLWRGKPAATAPPTLFFQQPVRAACRCRLRWTVGPSAPARHGIKRTFEGGISRKTEKDTKIEGTNSRIYCKQRSYRFSGLKTNWVLSAKNSKRTRKTAQKSRKNTGRRARLGNWTGSISTEAFFRVELANSGLNGASVLSQKLVEEVSPSADGRHNLAHGDSRGFWPQPPPSTPSPVRRGRGNKRGWGHSSQGFRPGLKYSAPDGAPKRRPA